MDCSLPCIRPPQLKLLQVVSKLEGASLGQGSWVRQDMVELVQQEVAKCQGVSLEQVELVQEVVGSQLELVQQQQVDVAKCQGVSLEQVELVQEPDVLLGEGLLVVAKWPALLLGEGGEGEFLLKKQLTGCGLVLPSGGPPHS